LNIPTYLQTPEEHPDYIYGTLSYSDKNSWLIEAEPCVIEMAKRLFPACESRGLARNQIRFFANKRTNGDLNWLMLRYPLKIINRNKYLQTNQETINHVLHRNELLTTPKKTTPPPNFKGTLKEFQKEGLAYLLHNRRTLLGDEMGTGKTPTALAFLAAANAWPALIVVPPHLRRGWTMQSGNFLNLPDPTTRETSLFKEPNEIPSFVHVIKGLRPYKLPEASIYIIHYLILRGWKQILPDFGFKAVIFDEIQELRKSESEKYTAATLVAERCENVIGLSGTPIYNYGGEIWNIMNALDYHCLSDKESFTRAWCDGYGSNRLVNPELLGQHLRREGLMIRRTKKEVLSELPDKRRIVEPIDVDEGLFSSLMHNAIEKAQNVEYIKDIFERGRTIQKIVEEARRATGIAKASSVCTFVKMLLDAGENVLLFGYHHDVFDIYLNELEECNPLEITGRKTQKDKDAAIEAYKAGKTNLLLLNLRTTAGLDGLQDPTTCIVFGELDWSPAVHSQCEDRAHRMGLKQSILCYYLVASDGSDANIQEALGLKVSQFTGLMGDTTETTADQVLAQTAVKEHMKKIVDRLKQMKPQKSKFSAIKVC